MRYKTICLKINNFLIIYVLCFVLEHGNVTTYEYIHKEAPQTTEDPFADIMKMKDDARQKQEAETNDAIDFGDYDGIDSADSLGSDDIDFGIEVEDDDEIDFGDDGADAGINLGGYEGAEQVN